MLEALLASPELVHRFHAVLIFLPSDIRNKLRSLFPKIDFNPGALVDGPSRPFPALS